MVLSKILFDIVLPSILENRFPEIKELTEEQSKALFGLLNREDVFAILPTGHGKSIIFQLLTAFCQDLHLRGYEYPRNVIVLVVCPLKSLVDSHIRELHCRDVTATSLGHVVKPGTPKRNQRNDRNHRNETIGTIETANLSFFCRKKG